MRRLNWATALATGALLAVAGSLTIAPAAAADEPEVDFIQQTKVDLAHALRQAATDPDARTTLYQALSTSDAVDPLTVFSGSRSAAATTFTELAVRADADVKQYLALDKMVESSLTVRLFDATGGLTRGVPPLFGAAPDEITNVTTAEDIDGRPVSLDLKTQPSFPLILVDLDMDNITPHGMLAISAALADLGVLSDVNPGGAVPGGVPAMATELDSIKLKHDGEPWYYGRAEIIAFAMGGNNGQARVDLVTLPNVDHAGTTYSPNTKIIFWQHFTWNRVDFLIMEGDWTACAAPWWRYAAAIAHAVSGLATNANYVGLNAAAIAALEEGNNICGNNLPLDLPDLIDSFNGLMQSNVGPVPGSKGNATTTMSLVNA